MSSPDRNPLSAWRWIPTLYFSQGIPCVVVMTLSVVMYKNLKGSNTDIALYTSWLYLPWVIKPLWSPLVDMFQTRRLWIVSLQLVVGAALALVALTVPSPNFFRYTLAIFWLLAFSSATHDIAADGFYLLALPQHQQAAFVGVRSTFYRLAMIAGQGGLVYLAGSLQAATGDIRRAWSLVFWVVAVFFVLVSLYHLIVLPRPASDHAAARGPQPVTGYFSVFAAFFRKKGVSTILGFLLLYRFAEAQLLKLVTPFLLGAREIGGLGLTTQQVGVIYGTPRHPLAHRRGPGGRLCDLSPGAQTTAVADDHRHARAQCRLHPPGARAAGKPLHHRRRAGGRAARLRLRLHCLHGLHDDGRGRRAQDSYYAIRTGFMALGMMLPGMATGWIRDHLGYVSFFMWVCVATIPSFVATALIKVDPAFGKIAGANPREAPSERAPVQADGP